MTHARWYITRHAIERYMHARRVDDFAAAQHAVLMLSTLATYRQRDELGRELWRCPESVGGWRMVLAPTEHPGEGRALKLVWMGQGKPPARLWTPPAATDELPPPPDAKRERTRR